MLPRSGNTGPAFTCSATQTHFIAGPLGVREIVDRRYSYYCNSK
jgi:hypothetical protein